MLRRDVVTRLAVVCVALVCAHCSGPSGTDDGADANDATMEAGDALELFDVRLDADDGEAGMDVPVDVQPASLPGRWRLVRFESTTAGGTTLDLTDVDQNIVYQGRSTYARVNGTMTLEGSRMAWTLGVAIGDHVLTIPGSGSSDAMAVYGGASAGTLGAMSFTPESGAAIAFRTNADMTISYDTTHPVFGSVTTSWQRLDPVPVVSGLAGQAMIVRLQPMTAAPLAHPRAALAWDRPGTGTGYVMTDDAPLVFIGSSPMAAVNLTVTYVLPEYTTDLDGTTLSVAQLIVYDDVDQNGQYDAGDVMASDGGVSVDGGSSSGGDPLRGVSRVLVTVRSETPPSAAFTASQFRDVPPGVHLGVARDDATVPGGRSIGPFDPTTRFPIDGVIEAGGTALTDWY